MQVNLAHQHQPYGPDASPAIEAQRAKGAALLAAADKAKARIVPRPVPGQYAELQAESQRFLGSMGSLQRLQSLLTSLQVPA